MAGGSRTKIKQPVSLPARMCSRVAAVSMQTNIQISILTRVVTEASPWYQRTIKKGFGQRELELGFEGYTDTLWADKNIITH